MYVAASNTTMTQQKYAGSKRFARRCMKVRYFFAEFAGFLISIVVIKKPEITKNISTPTHPIESSFPIAGTRKNEELKASGK